MTLHKQHVYHLNMPTDTWQPRCVTLELGVASESSRICWLMIPHSKAKFAGLVLKVSIMYYNLAGAKSASVCQYVFTLFLMYFSS